MTLTLQSTDKQTMIVTPVYTLVLVQLAAAASASGAHAPPLLCKRGRSEALTPGRSQTCDLQVIQDKRGRQLIPVWTTTAIVVLSIVAVGIMPQRFSSTLATVKTALLPLFFLPQKGPVLGANVSFFGGEFQRLKLTQLGPYKIVAYLGSGPRNSDFTQ